MKLRITFIVVMMSFFPLHAHAEEMIRKGELLNLQRALEIALMKNPGIVAARSTTSVNESKIGQAKSNYYPQVNWTSGYSRISSVSGRSFTGSQGGTFGTGSSASTSGSFDEYTASAALSQNIYDFGRTSTQVAISRLNFDSSRLDFENVTEQVILTVKQAYYGAVQAKYNKIVAEDTVKQTQQHLEQAKGFYEVGTHPKFDVIKAEVDVSTAKLNLIKAGNDLRIAFVNLNNAMGVPEAPEYTLAENISFAKYEITFEEALSKAYENRPDLKSLAAKRQAAVVSIDAAKTEYYPFLTGNASYNWAGGRLDQLDSGWNVGAVVSFPIFSGFLTKYQVDEAKANLNLQKANEESLRQTVFLEVQQAYLTLRAAEEAIPTAKLGVEQAQENLDIANGRYAAGVGNPIEVTDAEVSLANARTAYIQALYADKVAQANLEKAMGQR
ncbi:MAG: TolC family protein [Nitrospirae bacterium]|nr:TolC family protein [Nitrospirota bacterium]